MQGGVHQHVHPRVSGDRRVLEGCDGDELLGLRAEITAGRPIKGRPGHVEATNMQRSLQMT
jgi:hypothetical protein